MDQGLAAEHLVCADLLLKGHRAYLTSQSAPYDVIAETPRGLIRIQVKSILEPKRRNGSRSRLPVYVFRISQRVRGSLSAMAPYAGSVDLFALVALDTGHIAYATPASTTGRYKTLRPAGSRRHRCGSQIDEFPFASALKSLNARGKKCG